MTIGIFTDTYYPQISGVDTSVRILEKELRKLGHKVLIFTTTDPGARNKTPNVFRMPSLPFVFLPSRRFAFFYPPKLAVKMRRFKLDIIHTQTEFTMGIFGKVTAELLRIPLVHTYHTMYEDYVHYIAKGYIVSPKAARQYSRIFCNRADAVVTTSEKPKEKLLSYGVKRPITVVPTGIDLEPFSRGRFSAGDIANTRAELGLLPDEPVIMLISRVAKEKSIHMIINAMPVILKRHPKAKFVVVGDGPYVRELTDLAKKLGVENSVKFAGPRPWAEIGRFYMAGDVFVSASASETQGLTYIEAMAAKIPVVARRDKCIEGVVIDGETGFMFENENGLAGHVCSLFDDKSECLRISENAYAHVQSMSAAEFGRKIESVYNDLLSKRQHVPLKTRISRVLKSRRKK